MDINEKRFITWINEPAYPLPIAWTINNYDHALGKIDTCIQDSEKGITRFEKYVLASMNLDNTIGDALFILNCVWQKMGNDKVDTNNLKGFNKVN